jgi:glyoxylase-like metal-dependent hydrolase (beta-lactamase superfamily II)
VDGGESPASFRKALEIHKVGNLDLLAMTHFDADHIGGLEAVWQRHGIATYWAPCLPAGLPATVWCFNLRVLEEWPDGIRGRLSRREQFIKV